MKKLLLLALVVYLVTTNTIVEADAPLKPKVLSVVEYAQLYSEMYGANLKEVKWILADESGFTCVPKGHNDGGKAFGPAQYHKGTFLRYEKKMGIDLDYYSCHDQIKLMAWQFANIPSSKCEWSKYYYKYCMK